VAIRSYCGALGSLLLATLVQGCAGAPNGSVAPGSLPLARALAVPQTLLPSAKHGLKAIGVWMYSAQLYGEDLSVYKRSGLNLAFYKSFDGVSAPQGTEATVNGWWYVANSGASNLLVFKSTKNGPTGPVTTLDDSSEIPNNVSVIPSRRLVAASNYETVGGSAGSVSVYLDRQTEPARILKYGNDPIQGAGVAISHKGDCYFSFNDPNTKTGSIVEFSKCNGAGQVLALPTISSAGGIAFDQSDDLYYVDKTAGIYRCKKTSHCSLLPAMFGLPVNINFDMKAKYLWVADASGYIDAVDPTTGTIVYQKAAEGGPTDPPFGIAPAPGE
jgi:DNA-binding beta-propeller fold protein YncE